MHRSHSWTFKILLAARMSSSSIGGNMEEPENPNNGSKASLNISLQTSTSQKRLLAEEETLQAQNHHIKSKIIAIRKFCREWIKNPMNIAFVLWLTCVSISGAILFLVMTGMLNKTLTKKSQRDIWFEVNNQILNALFTLMCLYQHPKRFHHLFLLCRWKPKDICTLREVYCKNGTSKPNEWFHMMVVVLLLHVNCFAQYALCGLNLGYKRSERPNIGVAICLSIAIAAPALAGVYAIFSPLGKEYEEEAQNENISNHDNRYRCSSGSMEKRFSLETRNEENGECGVYPSLNSLPHEDKAMQFRTMSNTPLWSSPRLSTI
ncbi:PLAC8 motif-containing protein [Senna tora]|uniref:PLAC8 motif-containing protein n=1 Tax=Senna tora TaxID=362788 RepID=A0A835CM63_9FABA|nr:PLAC8 motif-containing protein [Senna tora]